MPESFVAGNRAIRMDVHSARPEPGRRAPAIILLHGAGGNIGFWLERLAPHLTQSGVSVFAPHYFERTDTVRADMAAITDGIHVPLWLDTVDAALQHVRKREYVDASRVAMVGISLGGFLTMSAAATRSTHQAAAAQVRCLVELSGGLPEPYASQATPRMPPTLIVHGTDDTVVPVSAAHELDSLLTRLGVEHEARILQREGHWFSGAGQMQLMLAVGSFLSRHLL